MKRLLSLLSALTIITLCHAEEVIVTTQNPQGWVFTTNSPNPSKPTTADWFLGALNGFPQLGKGSLWLYSGNADGSVHADFQGLKDVSLGSLTRLGYSTYTSNVAAGREDINMAAEFIIYLNVPGSPDGSIHLKHPPGLFGTVTRGQWTTRNILSEKWICSKLDSSDRRTLNQWLDLYPNATINRLQIMAGATTAPRTFAGWTLGVDNVIIGTGLAEPKTYNFEPGPPVQAGGPATHTPSSPSQTVNVTVVNPIVIAFPTYYISDGVPTGRMPTKDEPIAEQPVTPKPDKEPKPPATVEPYLSDDGMYIPVMFPGNISIKEQLSKLTGVGNPDAQPSSQPKITEGGAFLFGGVPFYIPKDKSAVWDSNSFMDNDSHALDVKVGLESVTEVHTMMGLAYPYSEILTVKIEFRGSKGAIFRKELKLNRDIRDGVTSDANTQTIVSPTKVVWVRPAPGRGQNHTMWLDKQVFLLPAEFATQELQTISIIDSGQHNKQRVILYGITAKVKFKGR